MGFPGISCRRCAYRMLEENRPEAAPRLNCPAPAFAPGSGRRSENRAERSWSGFLFLENEKVTEWVSTDTRRKYDSAGSDSLLFTQNNQSALGSAARGRSPRGRSRSLFILVKETFPLKYHLQRVFLSYAQLLICSFICELQNVDKWFIIISIDRPAVPNSYFDITNFRRSHIQKVKYSYLRLCVLLIIIYK